MCNTQISSIVSSAQKHKKVTEEHTIYFRFSAASAATAAGAATIIKHIHIVVCSLMIIKMTKLVSTKSLRNTLFYNAAIMQAHLLFS